MKNYITIFFLCFLNQAFSQVLQEGMVSFPNIDEDRVYISVPVPEKWVKQQRIKQHDNSSSGYFIYFLPPTYKIKKQQKTVKIDTSIIEWDYFEGDSIDYSIYAQNVEGYFRPYISEKYVNKNCASADVSKAIAIQFEKIPPKASYMSIKLAKKDIINIDTFTFEYDFYFIDTTAHLFVSRTWQPALLRNLPFGKFIFLQEQYYSEFREILCIDCRRNISIVAIQEALKSAGFSIDITGIIDMQTRNALIEYQKVRRLPQGRIDHLTLKSLDINDNQLKYFEYLNSPRYSKTNQD